MLYSLDLRAIQALSSIYRSGIEAPFVPQGYAEFSPKHVKELDATTKRVDSILEEECHDLFFIAASRDFSHLILRGPHFEFKGVMGPVPEECHKVLATSME
ncbi:hypothetical protein D1007_20610 [Hordeum vulgare]|nr:hypothetical protein D1007_20610 [Hordeum vulgare]